MMEERLHQQESDPAIQKLRRLMAGYAPPPRKAGEWDALESRIMHKLGADNKAILPAWLYFQHFTGVTSRAILGTSFVLFCTVALLSYFVLRSPIPEQKSYARIISIHGTTHLSSSKNRSRAGKRAVWENARVGGNISKGTTLETGSQSTCTILLEPKCGFTLAANTLIRIHRWDNSSFSAFLERGTCTFLVSPRQKRKNEYFDVATPNAECRVIGTLFQLSVLPEKSGKAPKTTLRVEKGSVAFGIPEKLMSVDAGMSATVDGNRVSRPQGVYWFGPSLENDVGELFHHLTLPTGKPGILSVETTPPGADLFVDGRYIGKSPVRIERQAGTYTIALASLDYSPLDTTISMKGETTTSLKFRLRKSAVHEDDAAQGSAYSASLGSRKKITTSRNASESISLTTLPAYRSAMNAIDKKQYTKALELLHPLAEHVDLSPADRIRVLEHIVSCSRHIGKLNDACDALSRAYELSSDTRSRDNMLWKLIDLRTQTGEYELVEMDLVSYILAFRNGTWVSRAYTRLAEVQYILGKYKLAARTYETYIREFPGDRKTDQILYALARVVRRDLNDCERAIQCYKRILEDFPNSPYRAESLYWQALCHEDLGRRSLAQQLFNEYLVHFPNGRRRKDIAQRGW